jgi:uncharacterized protein (DUF2249 family)
MADELYRDVKPEILDVNQRNSCCPDGTMSDHFNRDHTMHHTHDGSVRLLDVGGLAPPQPMQHILEALDTLGPDERLRVLIDRDPLPLYPVLRRYGFQHSTTPRGERFEVLIWMVPGGGAA